MIVFQYVFSWLRKVVTGMSDEQFYQRIQAGTISGFRNAFLGRLFRCHTWMGFWVGGELYALGAYGFIGDITHHAVLGYILAGLLQSVFNTVAWMALLKLGAQYS